MTTTARGSWTFTRILVASRRTCAADEATRCRRILQTAGMALITSFEHRPDAGMNYRSEVRCGYSVGHVGQTKILHLETYGSASRAIPGKVSQSVELDEEAARAL